MISASLTFGERVNASASLPIEFDNAGGATEIGWFVLKSVGAGVLVVGRQLSSDVSSLDASRATDRIGSAVLVNSVSATHNASSCPEDSDTLLSSVSEGAGFLLKNLPIVRRHGRNATTATAITTNLNPFIFDSAGY